MELQLLHSLGVLIQAPLPTMHVQVLSSTTQRTRFSSMNSPASDSVKLDSSTINTVLDNSSASSSQEMLEGDFCLGGISEEHIDVRYHEGNGKQ